jgi:hypothetical protein
MTPAPSGSRIPTDATSPQTRGAISAAMSRATAVIAPAMMTPMVYPPFDSIVFADGESDSSAVTIAAPKDVVVSKPADQWPYAEH